MEIDYRRLVPADADLLAEFLTAESWPFHAGRTPDPGRIRHDVIDGTTKGIIRIIGKDDGYNI